MHHGPWCGMLAVPEYSAVQVRTVSTGSSFPSPAVQQKLGLTCMVPGEGQPHPGTQGLQRWPAWSSREPRAAVSGNLLRPGVSAARALRAGTNQGRREVGGRRPGLKSAAPGPGFSLCRPGAPGPFPLLGLREDRNRLLLLFVIKPASVVKTPGRPGRRGGILMSFSEPLLLCFLEKTGSWVAGRKPPRGPREARAGELPDTPSYPRWPGEEGRPVAAPPL